MVKVLAAPAEYYFRPGNYHISYNLISRLNDVEFKVITSSVDDSVKKLPNANFVELRTCYVKYPIKVFLAAKKLEKWADVIHHMSPFPLGKEFNFFTIDTKKPVVVGPIEIPHRFFEDEMSLFGIPKLFWKLKDNSLRDYFSAKTLENADILVAVNVETKKKVLEYTGGGNVVVIPLGVDTEFFTYCKVPDNYRILMIGMHIKRKGFDYMIQAMPEILREFPEAELHIVSSGPRTQYLKELALKLGVNKKVFFHGRVDDAKLLRLYHTSRIFCHPSLSESFSPVRAEAMATGRPIVATNTASGAEELIDRKCGVLVEPANPKALAEAVKKLFSDYNACVKMGLYGRRKVEKTYSWDLVVSKYKEIYESLV